MLCIFWVDLELFVGMALEGFGSSACPSMVMVNSSWNLGSGSTINWEDAPKGPLSVSFRSTYSLSPIRLAHLSGTEGPQGLEVPPTDNHL